MIISIQPAKCDQADRILQFIPQDTTEVAKSYEALKTQPSRDSEIYKRIRAINGYFPD